MEKPVHKYTLTLTEKQAQVLVTALDLYERVGMGQFRELIRHHWRTSVSHEDRDEAEGFLDKAHVLLTGLPRNAYYGIRSPKISDDYRVAYDLHQVVRHKLAWDRNPKGDYTVDFDAVHVSSDEPIAEMTDIKVV